MILKKVFLKVFKAKPNQEKATRLNLCGCAELHEIPRKCHSLAIVIEICLLASGNQEK